MKRGGQKSVNLTYACDTLLIGENEKGLQSILNKVITESNLGGLECQLSKHNKLSSNVELWHTGIQIPTWRHNEWLIYHRTALIVLTLSMPND